MPALPPAFTFETFDKTNWSQERMKLMSVQNHYNQHLGRIYSWMVGGIESAMARGSSEINCLVKQPTGSGVAVDLGSGFGMHAIPLARLGFNVLAIDSCDFLLAELRAQKAELPVEGIKDDLRFFHRHLRGKVELALCMGDTLTHLPDQPAVFELIRTVSEAMESGGRFVISLRDYSIPLTDEQRFIPVRSARNRTLTCFLEYSATHVTVHDLLYEWDGTDWNMRVSAYQKLRLAPEQVKASLEANHFAVARSPGIGGMVTLVARRT